MISFNMFVQTIVQCMDLHTDYFSPVEKRFRRTERLGSPRLKDDDGNIATLICSPARSDP